MNIVSELTMLKVTLQFSSTNVRATYFALLFAIEFSDGKQCFLSDFCPFVLPTVV